MEGCAPSQPGFEFVSSTLELWIFGILEYAYDKGRKKETH